MRKEQSWIPNRHWWLIFFIAVLLAALEGFDFSRLKNDPVHLAELLIYLAMLAIIGVLYDSTLRGMNAREKMRKIIDQKHKLSLEFSSFNDWDVLATQLVRFPVTVTEIEQSCLYVSEPISNRLELVAQWPPADQKTAKLVALSTLEKYMKEKPTAFLEFIQCGTDGLPGSLPIGAQSFCLPVRYGQAMIGMILFTLSAGQTLTHDQQTIFENIGDEIGFALKVGQDRKKYLEMNTSETTLAERRRVSHYLHDHLGHNLGYLHFKLDQLITMKDQLTLENVLPDLEHLRKAARDAYEVVRGTLETMQPETTPMLTNLLAEHARKVSKRSQLEIDFQTIGKQLPLAMDVKRAIFYVFEEALSNVEKHAQASKLIVITEWGEDTVSLTISDNGVGFKPDEVNTDQHFGLEILRERLEQVGGQVSLVTTEKLGTTVSVRVPLPVLHLSGAKL